MQYHVPGGVFFHQLVDRPADLQPHLRRFQVVLGERPGGAHGGIDGGVGIAVLLDEKIGQSPDVGRRM